MLTTVIKVSGRARDRLLADPDFVYCGRPFAGFEGSPWGNPFKPGMSGDQALAIITRIPKEDLTDHWKRDTRLVSAVERFEFYLLCRKSLLAQIPDLRGKTLGCWCTNWDGTGNPKMICHAMILARLANELGMVP